MTSKTVTIGRTMVGIDANIYHAQVAELSRLRAENAELASLSETLDAALKRERIRWQTDLEERLKENTTLRSQLRVAREALAAYDTDCAKCPINNGRFEAKACAACGTLASQSCGIEGGASYRLILAIRSALMEKTDGS